MSRAEAIRAIANKDTLTKEDRLFLHALAADVATVDNRIYNTAHKRCGTCQRWSAVSANGMGVCKYAVSDNIRCYKHRDDCSCPCYIQLVEAVIR